MTAFPGLPRYLGTYLPTMPCMQCRQAPPRFPSFPTPCHAPSTPGHHRIPSPRTRRNAALVVVAWRFCLRLAFISRHVVYSLAHSLTHSLAHSLTRSHARTHVRASEMNANLFNTDGSKFSLRRLRYCSFLLLLYLPTILLFLAMPSSFSSSSSSSSSCIHSF